MWGSTIPTVYYGFYYNPVLQKVYWTVVSPHPVTGIGQRPILTLNAAGIYPSTCVRVRYTQSTISSSNPSSISCGHVRRARAICSGLRNPWHSTLRLGDSSESYERGPDGLNGSLQSNRRLRLRRTGMLCLFPKDSRMIPDSSTGPGKVVSPKIRHRWKQPPDSPHHGHPRRLGAL